MQLSFFSGPIIRIATLAALVFSSAVWPLSCAIASGDTSSRKGSTELASIAYFDGDWILENLRPDQKELRFANRSEYKNPLRYDSDLKAEYQEFLANGMKIPADFWHDYKLRKEPFRLEREEDIRNSILFEMQTVHYCQMIPRPPTHSPDITIGIAVSAVAQREKLTTVLRKSNVHLGSDLVCRYGRDITAELCKELNIALPPATQAP